MSTTHLAMISALNEENTISGVSGARFIYRNSIYERFKNDKLPDVGYEGNLNKELIIQISPDLIMMYGIGSESAGYVNKIKELGVKTIFNADYLETDPLGKAEWIKLFGALYCKEEMADSIFRSLSEEYLLTKSYIEKNTANKPKVLLGLPYKDTWFISPGNSYISTIITDAGGDYLWKETESSYSMPYGIENVYLKALAAEYWLNTGSAYSKDDIISVDKRLADLECFKKANLYNNNNRVNENGGNDYWESGSLYPQLILRDIAAIIHPGLFPDALYYYRKLD
jgi:iron complex transport system substrate-binding protein